MTDWWLFNNKVHGGLECTQVNRSQFPRSFYTHELAEFRRSDKEWRKSQLLKDKSQPQSVLHFCRDTPRSRIEFTLKKEDTSFKFHCDQRGKLSAYFLIELVPKASLGCFIFCLAKTRSSIVSSPCREPHGCSWDTKVCLPQTLLFY